MPKKKPKWEAAHSANIQVPEVPFTCRICNVPFGLPYYVEGELFISRVCSKNSSHPIWWCKTVGKDKWFDRAHPSTFTAFWNPFIVRLHANPTYPMISKVPGSIVNECTPDAASWYLVCVQYCPLPVGIVLGAIFHAKVAFSYTISHGTLRALQSAGQNWQRGYPKFNFLVISICTHDTEYPDIRNLIVFQSHANPIPMVLLCSDMI